MSAETVRIFPTFDDMDVGRCGDCPFYGSLGGPRGVCIQAWFGEGNGTIDKMFIVADDNIIDPNCPRRTVDTKESPMPDTQLHLKPSQEKHVLIVAWQDHTGQDHTNPLELSVERNDDGPYVAIRFDIEDRGYATLCLRPLPANRIEDTDNA